MLRIFTLSHFHATMWENTAYDAVLIDKERITTGGNCSLLGGAVTDFLPHQRENAPGTNVERVPRRAKPPYDRSSTLQATKKNRKTAYYENDNVRPMVILNKRSACFSPFNFHEVKKKKEGRHGMLIFKTKDTQTKGRHPRRCLPLLKEPRALR